MNKLFLKAPAKLNLHLQVINKRSDGFHNISSFFSLIGLYDEINIKLINDQIVLKEEKPIENNLVLKAANLLKYISGTKKGAEIELLKRIPDQAGLGGGSSDAATTLVGLNNLWNLNLSKKELLKIGLELGSDIPFFINGKSSWVEGRGEIFSTANIDERWYVLFFPKTKISTQLAFKNLTISNEAQITKEEFLNGNSMNSFYPWVIDNYIEINALVKRLKNFGNPQLTGTGSTIFLACKTKQVAKKIILELSEGFLVKSLHDSPLLEILE